MRPPDQVARELAHEWLAKADVDLSAANALLSAGDLFPKTHDIERLLELCASVEPEVAAALASAAELTPYGVEYRYPGEYPPVSKEAAELSLATAQLVLGEVAKRFSDTPGR